MALHPDPLWLVLTTEADQQRASALAEQLISLELAACVQRNLMSVASPFFPALRSLDPLLRQPGHC